MKRKITGAALLSCSAVTLLLGSCGNAQKGGAPGGMMPKPTVVATTVEPTAYTVTESFPGTLVANNMVEIRPDVTGYLEAIRASDGSWVQKGQPLYEIDKSRYSAAYNQSAAALQQAQADLAQRQRDLERYQNLLQHDAISRQTVDQAETAVKTAQANVAAAQAAQAKSGTDLNHAIIKAPFSGRIGIAQVKTGAIINAGQTLINTLVNEDPMYVDFDIPQSRFHEFVSEEQHPSPSRKFYIRFTDGKVYEQDGKILLINNTVDQTTGTIRVRLVFPNKNGELKSGMSCVVLDKHRTPENSLAIPPEAIIQILDETNVYVVDEHHVIRSRDITPGAQTDSLLIVQEGLKAGDIVVVSGLQKTKPGDTVNVQMKK
ncbi:efflux RND transporter periplasmic adaptor subunit [Compostibacter hankyongensis]